MFGDFQNLVKTQRNQLQMTGAELATKLGKKSPSYVSKVESGETEIPAEEAERWIKVLFPHEYERLIYTAAIHLDWHLDQIARHPGFPLRSQKIGYLMNSAAHYLAVLYRATPSALVTLVQNAPNWPMAFGDKLTWFQETYMSIQAKSPTLHLYKARAALIPARDNRDSTNGFVTPLPKFRPELWPGPTFSLLVDEHVVIGVSNFTIDISFDPALIGACVGFLKPAFDEPSRFQLRERFKAQNCEPRGGSK